MRKGTSSYGDTSEERRSSTKQDAARSPELEMRASGHKNAAWAALLEVHIKKYTEVLKIKRRCLAGREFFLLENAESIRE